MDFLEHFGITIALNVINSAIKNPSRKAALQEYMIQLRDAINALYPGA